LSIVILLRIRGRENIGRDIAAMGIGLPLLGKLK
jgi:hypothetical protein